MTTDTEALRIPLDPFVSDLDGESAKLRAAGPLAAVELPSHKLGPLSHLTDANQTQLAQTLWRLHHLRRRYPDLLMVPAHDAAAFAALETLAQHRQ